MRAQLEHTVVDSCLGPVTGHVDLVFENGDVAALGAFHDFQKSVTNRDLAAVDLLLPELKTACVWKATKEIDVHIGKEGTRGAHAVEEGVQVLGFLCIRECIRDCLQAHARLAITGTVEKLFQLTRPEGQTARIGGTVIVSNIKCCDLLLGGQGADVISHGFFFPLCSTLPGCFKFYSVCSFRPSRNSERNP